MNWNSPKFILLIYDLSVVNSQVLQVEYYGFGEHSLEYVPAMETFLSVFQIVPISSQQELTLDQKSIQEFSY